MRIKLYSQPDDIYSVYSPDLHLTNNLQLVRSFLEQSSSLTRTWARVHQGCVTNGRQVTYGPTACTG